MTQRELVRMVVAHIEACEAPYLIVGGIAYNFYGTPRSTKDVDFVLSMPPADLDRVLATLPAQFVLEPQARMELFTGTMRWIAGVTGTEWKTEFFLLGADAHHREEFQRRRRVWLPGVEIEAWLARPEDLIIQKLRWARNKDLDDVRNILSVQGDALDFPYLHSWCERHGTRERLEEIRRSIPEL